jgi:4-diphosphocytidyl-2-C-methyl-D-erythritol kinase
MSGLRTRAHAKVNLGLRVLGKRPDGYHELWTVFDEIELHDDLRFTPGAGGGISLSVVDEAGTGLAVPSDERNLVVKAARAFASATRRAVHGRFDLVKRIPAGAGLGGGSSDAAAALRLLAEAAGLAATDATVVAAARETGADVPFFLHGGRAWATGRGDVIHPLAAGPRLFYVLLFPGYACPTADVFARWHRALTDAAPAIDSPPDKSAQPLPPARDAVPDPTAFVESLLSKGRDAPAQGLFNDLDQAAAAAYPRLGRLRRRLLEAGFTVVHLSGSGSTLFLAGGSDERARQIEARLVQTVGDLQARGADELASGARVMLTRSRR